VIPVAPGAHEIEVQIGDNRKLEEWRYETGQKLLFTRAARRVIAFDRLDGFTVH
jgi:hypothetical protein